MEKKKLIVIIAAAVCLVAVIAAVIIACVSNGSGGVTDAQSVQSGTDAATQTETGENETGFPELEIISVTEVGEWVEVDTTYGKFHYPYAFSDIISFEAESTDSTAQIKFYANLDGTKTLMYTLHYSEKGDDDWDLCGTFKPSDNAEAIAVYVEFEEAPGDVSGDWLTTFLAARETFNDVISSMDKNEGFTSVK